MLRAALVTNSDFRKGGSESWTRMLRTILQRSGIAADIYGYEEACSDASGQAWFGSDEASFISTVFQSTRAHRYDVVIANGEYGQEIHHPNVINVHHGNYFGRLQATSMFLNRRERTRLQSGWIGQLKASRGKYNITVSHQSATDMKKGGVQVHEVIRNVLSLDKRLVPPRQRKARRNFILYPTRYKYYEKGLDIVAGLQHLGWKVLLATDYYRDARKARFCAVPWLDLGTLLLLYARAAAVILPSRYEGGSMVAVEAMTVGCPLVCTRTGYGEEISKEIPEVVADCGDVREFDRRLKRVIGNANIQERLRQYAAKYHNPLGFEQRWVRLIRACAAGQLNHRP